MLRTCRCYTNHALDQFLEHLLTITNRIVRIGSRSNSEKLSEYNLQEWAKNQAAANKTRVQKRKEWEIIETLEVLGEAGAGLCQTFNEDQKVQWERLSAFLKRNYSSHYSQLVGGVDADGFEKVGRKGGNYFYYWISCSDLKDREKFEELYGTSSREKKQDQYRPLNELLSRDADIWDFSRNERKRLLGHWKGALAQDWTDELVGLSQNFEEERTKLEELRSDYNRQLLESADVIGLTTTGLARYAPLLDRISAKTLICEEAGEVLEVGTASLTLLTLSGSHVNCTSPHC